MNLSPEISYDEAIQHLYSLEYTGMKLGLDNINALMEALGNPHRAFPAIHVAGTNGKGSVCNMLAAALQANGYKTGLFTSPHLVSYTERMKIDGKPIAEERLTEYFIGLWPAIEQIHATFFEATTAIAFQYFRDEKVDIAVIETGLGGRLDATNILERPLATVITSIGLEHTEILGDTLEKIAYEKACILKPSVPAIVNAPEQTHNMFIDKAREVDAPLFFVNLNNNIAFDSDLKGEHQKENTLTVLECLKQLSLPLDHETSFEGIAHTTQLTGLRARLEEYAYEPAVKKGVRLFLDVAHNPDGLMRVRDYFLKQNTRPVVVVGFAKDKAISSSLEIIKSFSSCVIGVSAHMSRSLSVEDLRVQGKNVGLKIEGRSDIVEAVTFGISISKGENPVLLTGSHYVIGEFLRQVS